MGGCDVLELIRVWVEQQAEVPTLLDREIELTKLISREATELVCEGVVVLASYLRILH